MCVYGTCGGGDDLLTKQGELMKKICASFVCAYVLCALLVSFCCIPASVYADNERPVFIAVIVGTYHGHTFKTEMPVSEKNIDTSIDLLHVGLYAISGEMEGDGKGDVMELALAGEYRGERFTITSIGTVDEAIESLVGRLKERILRIRKKIFV